MHPVTQTSRGREGPQGAGGREGGREQRQGAGGRKERAGDRSSRFPPKPVPAAAAQPHGSTWAWQPGSQTALLALHLQDPTLFAFLPSCPPVLSTTTTWDPHQPARPPSLAPPHLPSPLCTTLRASPCLPVIRGAAREAQLLRLIQRERAQACLHSGPACWVRHILSRPACAAAGGGTGAVARLGVPLLDHPGLARRPVPRQPTQSSCCLLSGTRHLPAQSGDIEEEGGGRCEQSMCDVSSSGNALPRRVQGRERTTWERQHSSLLRHARSAVERAHSLRVQNALVCSIYGLGAR